MSKVTVFGGLDYHKDSIQVCVMDHTGQMLANRRCTNHVEALGDQTEARMSLALWRMVAPAVAARIA